MDLEQKSIERIKVASEMSLRHYGLPLVCTYSGGKDSDVMLELFKRSGVPFEVKNSHTTVDAPPTVYHIREQFRRLEEQGITCGIDYHNQPSGGRITMWNLIKKTLLPPTRKMRYCCTALKEADNKNRMIATGVRWAESQSRKNREAYEVLGRTKRDKIVVSEEKMLMTDNDDTRKLFERCELKAKIVVNPIIDWQDNDIWDFYWSECKHHNPLYKMGYYRVGCIGCPLAEKKSRLRGFRDFPTYKGAYIRAFDRMLDERHAVGKPTKWKSGNDVFLRWMEDENIEGQMDLFEDGFLE